MKFLVVGLGSMGKRRIRNLKHLSHSDIIGYDVNQSRGLEVETEYSIKVFSNLDEALAQRPNAVIISTPPDKHYDVASIIAENKLPFFMEANVIPNGFDTLMEKCIKNKIFFAPSCTLRFNPSLKKIHELIQKNAVGTPLQFVYHVGQYLPDWHPYEDYRKFYVSKRSSGACREIVPFELNWIVWTFGRIKKLTSMKRKISNLDTDIDDIYASILEFENGMIGNLVIDVLSRIPYRTLRIICEDGVILWDWTEKKVKLYRASTKSWEEFQEPLGIKIEGYVAEEDAYIDEMKSFVDGLKDPKKYSHTPQNEHYILELLSRIEDSSDKGIQLNMK